MRTFLIGLCILTVPFVNAATDNSLPKISANAFTPFTGKVAKNKVRMRTGPNLDAAIIRELNKGELVIVLGESDEFYAIQPPTDVKGYIFRTFVLDNKVEGNKVNVRLAPNTESPVIAQMNSGDMVDGSISPLNSKWMEITPPVNTRFFIAKEYVEKAGDQNFMAKIAKRREEVNQLLESNYVISQKELQKPFPQISIDRIVANYQKIANDYPDFPEQTSRAKELLEELNETFLHKKIEYLEAKAENRPVATVEPMGFPAVPLPQEDPQARMEHWKPVEDEIYHDWSQQNAGTQDDFYKDQKKSSTTLTGVLEPYTRAVKNKPGDYLLVDKDTKQPVAFLYSTKVNLNDKIGKPVTIEAVTRDNHHFAYPAYFVLTVK